MRHQHACRALTAGSRIATDGQHLLLIIATPAGIRHITPAASYYFLRVDRSWSQTTSRFPGEAYWSLISPFATSGGVVRGSLHFKAALANLDPA